MTFIELQTTGAIAVAVLLWFSGALVGAIVSVPLTMFYVYRKGQQWSAEREEE